ncbi:hypothetical protein McanMca71_000802 [Microsporum canis]|uniref:AMP-dependent synthetase/ligase n=1 Tax=Arthroderma otae (strain ATCC MYA-4605 / CBS 113480) TaxID=554155 RepID=C5FIR4_ARTOC|nr:AMP-dependent synthetase/ligase [Microsporum canis CBS 113480]EEQ29155.1 AMP-dependent synthetase/ligase [Microsporum canis CBS 113480]
MEDIKERFVLELIKFARQKSDYYRQLYESLPQDIVNIESLPITDVEDYWRLARSDPKNVLTGPFIDGVPLRSGGSTNEPKTIFSTRDEVTKIAKIEANLRAQTSGILPGDRVANLFTFGGLYGGYWYAIALLQEIPIPLVHLPISGSQPLDKIVEEMEVFEATVILAPVFTIILLAEHLTKKGRSLDNIRVIVFSGESLFEDTRPLWGTAYPNAKIYSSFYGGVDVGPLGVPARTPACFEEAFDPTFKMCFPAVLMEIIAEDGTVIKEPGIRGNVVATTLVRYLQPMIRYPVGDVAEWVDYEARTFKHRGRASIAIKVATTFLDLPLIKKIIAEVLGSSITGRFQCIVRRKEGSAILTFRLAIPKPEHHNQIRDEVEAALSRASPKWRRDRECSAIAPLILEWVDNSGLLYSEKSGKLREIVDERY